MRESKRPFIDFYYKFITHTSDCRIRESYLDYKFFSIDSQSVI